MNQSLAFGVRLKLFFGKHLSMSKSKVELIRALLKSIETGEPEAVSVVDESKYIQHNPQTHEGSEGLATLFKRLSKTEPRVNMVRGFEDGDFVFAHMEYDFSSRKICFEVFRFEHGRAVEHWDNIQERRGPNQSGHTMVDGSIELGDLEHTEENRALVKAFAETVLIEKQTERLKEFFAENQYIEHNPDFEDDVTSLKRALTCRGSSYPTVNYQKLHRVLAQGNFVLTVCEGERDLVHTSFYDLFRVSNGCIVEHWDTTEKIVPVTQWKNSNGKF